MVVEYITGVVTSCLGCRTSNDCLGTGLCVAWVSVLVIVVTGDDTGSITGIVTGSVTGIPMEMVLQINKTEHPFNANKFVQNAAERH